VLSRPKISVGKNLTLDLLAEPMRKQFAEEVGRLLGLTSSYVHLTPKQIQERISAVDSGWIAGRDTVEDVEVLNAIVNRVLASSLALLFHSVPDWVAGDWLVEGDGSSNNWHFGKSRFIASIDAHFDYKAERQEKLTELQEVRRAKIEF
jgi:hypothetical protein